MLQERGFWFRTPLSGEVLILNQGVMPGGLCPGWLCLVTLGTILYNTNYTIQTTDSENW